MERRSGPASEHIASGQRIESVTLAREHNGQWLTFYSGEVFGCKRMSRFDGAPNEYAEEPRLSETGVHWCLCPSRVVTWAIHLENRRSEGTSDAHVDVRSFALESQSPRGGCLVAAVIA
jgi:hypothetical protein